MQNEVKHIRLINGEELLAIVDKANENEYLFQDPLVVSSHDDGRTERIVLLRYAPYAKSSIVPIQRIHVLTCSDVHEEMRRHYFLSLKVNEDMDRASIDALRQVNSTMEQALVDVPKKRRASLMAPGSSSKH